jgi:hypothetical protein
MPKNHEGVTEHAILEEWQAEAMREQHLKKAMEQHVVKEYLVAHVQTGVRFYNNPWLDMIAKSRTA